MSTKKDLGHRNWRWLLQQTAATTASLIIPALEIHKIINHEVVVDDDQVVQMDTGFPKTWWWRPNFASTLEADTKFKSLAIRLCPIFNGFHFGWRIPSTNSTLIRKLRISKIRISVGLVCWWDHTPSAHLRKWAPMRSLTPRSSPFSRTERPREHLRAWSSRPRQEAYFHTTFVGRAVTFPNRGKLLEHCQVTGNDFTYTSVGEDSTTARTMNNLDVLDDNDTSNRNVS